MPSLLDRVRSLFRRFVDLAKTVAVGFPVLAVSHALGGPQEFAAAQAQIEQSQNQAFAAHLSEWLQLKPQDEETRFLYARILIWDHQWEESLTEYDTLLAGAADNVDYLLGKAQVLVWSGQAAAAMPVLERALELDPSSTPARDGLALCPPTPTPEGEHDTDEMP